MKVCLPFSANKSSLRRVSTEKSFINYRRDWRRIKGAVSKGYLWEFSSQNPASLCGQTLGMPWHQKNTFSKATWLWWIERSQFSKTFQDATGLVHWKVSFISSSPYLATCLLAQTKRSSVGNTLQWTFNESEGNHWTTLPVISIRFFPCWF